MEQAQVSNVTEAIDKQAHTAETPATEATETKQDFLSPKFAALARKEKQIRAEKLKIEQERSQWAERERELEELKAFKQKFEQNPLDLVDYNKLTEAYLAQPNPELKPLLAKISELEKSQQNILKASEESQKTQREQAKVQIGKEIERMVTAGEEFEAMKAYGKEAVNAALELIEQTFDESGELMEYSDACQQIEEYLAEQALETYQKFSTLKKVQAKLNPPKQEPEAQAATPAPEQKQNVSPKQPQPTLSNRIVQSGASKPMTDKERRERAIRAFMGQPTK